jgi:hypothetical protein
MYGPDLDESEIRRRRDLRRLHLQRGFLRRVVPLWLLTVVGLLIYFLSTARGKGALPTHGDTIAFAIAAVGSILMGIVWRCLR